MKHPIGQTRNAIPVYAKLIGSAAGKSIARQPQLLSLAKEMLAKVTLHSPDVNVEYDMKRLIGYSFVVETSDKDTVFYGRLLKENVYTRFVKNGKPLPTRYLTVMLSQDSDGDYELSDIWIGHFRPPQPGSDSETVESKTFWSNHAFILDNQPLQLQTVTKVCPY